MRLRIILLVVAISSMVLIAFLVPLALVLRTSAADRAVSAATVRAQWMAPLVATLSGAGLKAAVAQVNAQDKAQAITVFLPGGPVLGHPAGRSAGVRLAAKGRSFSTPFQGGVEVLVAVQGLPRGTAVIRAFVPGAQLRAGVGRSWLVLGGVGLGLLLLSVAVADQLARSLVRTLRALARVADQLAAGNLGTRAEVAGPPEMRQVSTGLNRLAARIGELLAHERETAADLSHRLRTPLTALRIDAESLQDDGERAQVLSDVDGLQRTVNEIIREARRPAGQGTRVACDAAQVVAGRAAFWQPLAEDQDRRLATTIAPGPVLVGVSRDDLAACTDILLENVFSHTPEGTAFSVRVSHRAGRGRLGGGVRRRARIRRPGRGPPRPLQRRLHRPGPGHRPAHRRGLGRDPDRRPVSLGRRRGHGRLRAAWGIRRGRAAGRRVRPQLLRRRPGGEAPGWPDDPPPWAELADRGRRPPYS